jgi:hypothetical protein
VTAPRVAVAGGRSAGHIEPAMNYAGALRRLGAGGGGGFLSGRAAIPLIVTCQCAVARGVVAP